ncbi:MAG: hypothetical protein ABSG90_12715 [Dehalococcoidia bacterium]|jgi:hypothetical protein
MPLIPTSITPKEVPMPELSPGMAGAPFAAVEKAAEGIESTAQYGAKVYRAIQSAEDHVSMLKTENLVNGDIEKVIEGFEQRTDYNNFTGDIQKQTDELLKKYHDQLGNNERIWNHVEPWLGGKINTVKHAIEMKRLKLLTEDGKYQLDIAADEASQQWSELTQQIDHATEEAGITLISADADASILQTGVDLKPKGIGKLLAQRAAVENEYRAKLTLAANDHIITAHELHERTQKFLKKREESEVILGLKSNDPSLIVRTLKKMDAGIYKDIDPKELANFQTYGENRLEVVKNKMDREQGELAVNASIGKLESRWQHEDGSFDFGSAERELQSEDFRRENGLLDKNGNPNRKLINEAETYIHAKNADTERIQREGKEKEARGVIEDIVGGKLGEASKKLKQSKFLKGTPEGLQLLNGIRTWGKRTDEDVSNHEDRKEYLRIQELIDGGNYDEAKKEIVNTNHLKSGTAFALLGRLDNRELKDTNHGLSQANKYLTSQIAPSKGALLPSIPAETEKAAQAQQELQKWVKEETKKATEGKRVPVTTEEIFNKAKEIVPHYRMKIDEKVKSIKESMQSGKPSGWEKIKGFFVPKYTPSTEAKQENTITTKSGKQAWLWPDGQYHYSAPTATAKTTKDIPKSREEVDPQYREMYDLEQAAKK